jgi:hypothetical protein
LFVKNGDLLKGSARSIEAVNIFEALKSCSQFIKEFGGHSQAAGVNIELDDFENLKNALNDYLTDKYSFESFTPTIYTCKNVEPKKCVRFAKEIELLEPFGVGNKRPMFVREEKVCAVRPIKKQSPHLLIKCEGLDFMYFNGAKSAKLLLCGAPKKLVFEYNVSSFRGKEQVKGFVRDIVYEGKELRCAAEMIALNNVLSFSDSYANPNFNRVTNLLLHNELARDIEPYGTIFIANDYQTLDSFPEAKKYPVELFNLTSRNLANTVLVSPETDVDLTGFVRIFWLDNPRRVSIRSTAGKLVQVAESLKNSNRTILGLDCDRKNLLAFYNELVTSLPNIEGENIFEVALKNKFSVSAAQAAFALGVFFELGLLSFEDERLTIYRGIKTNLSQSELYQRVKTEIENYENTLKVIEENK